MKKQIDLSGVNETMLVPLYARALESKRRNPAFHDKTAVRIIDALDYDFAKHEQKMNMWGCAARTILFDREAGQYIEKYPDCTVINLACGLDDRFSRLDNGRIKWYNIDFENIIALRKDLIEPNERVTDIASSALDFAWMEQVALRPQTLIIAEGFLMYLTEEEVRSLFDRIAEHFENSTLLLELMSTWMVKNQSKHDTIKKTGAVFRWGVTKTEDFTKLCPTYKMTGDYNFTDTMKRYSPVMLSIFSLFFRSKNNRLGRFEKITD